MTVSAHDAARELRGRLGDGLGQTKLQKLLFYVQAWSLAWRGEAFFVEQVKAYRNGPVVHDHWADETHNRDLPAPQPVVDDGLIDLIAATYGGLTKNDLIVATHNLECWQAARRAAGDDLAWLEEDPYGWHENDGIRSLPIEAEAMAQSIITTDEYQQHLDEIERHSRAVDRFTRPLEDSPDLVARINEAIGL